MRVHIVVTADDGSSYEGDADLIVSSPAANRTKPAAKGNAETTSGVSASAVDFELPVRAFAKRYAKNLSGPRKYVALLARLAGGKVGHANSPRDVEKQWRSMTEPMGGDYNPAYPSRAKTEGWIDAPTRDTVVLRKDWAAALNGN